MEEQVGAIWHKLISGFADTSFPQAAVQLSDIKPRLSVYYHALGHNAGLKIDLSDAIKNPAARNWKQRLAGINARIPVAFIDNQGVSLPPVLSHYEQSALNRDLYYWLTSIAAVADREMAELHPVAFNQRLTTQALSRFPGLRQRYFRLAEAHIAQRKAMYGPNPARREIETAIHDALRHPEQETHVDIPGNECLTVPLWLHAEHNPAAVNARDDGEPGGQHSHAMRELEDIGKRKAKHIDEPDSDRGLITVRMENIFTMGEFVNVDRGSEEEDDIDRAEDVARDLDQLAVSRNANTAKATLKFDLDLPPEASDDHIVDDGLLLPEWDWKPAILKPDHCRIVELVAKQAPACALPDHLSLVARRLRRQFQALAPARHWLKAQPDGQDIDLDACIRFACERRTGAAISNVHLYRSLNNAGRDLSCLLLADLSLSTDAYINNQQRIVDVIRDSLFLFSECLHANGDLFSLFGFSSRKRDPVRMHRLKGFDEAYDATIRGRISAIKPGYYTRLGAGIRFAARQLIEQGHGKRLLLVLTDGKPNDLDQYEGRYGIEDTHHAIMTARKQGLLPFCVTIDHKGNEYLPYLFGRNNYVVIRNAEKLPQQLPRLYSLFAQSQ